MKRRIEIRSSGYPVSFNGAAPQHAFVSPGGDVVTTTRCSHNETAAGMIKARGWEDDWKKGANKVYTSSEYLVAVKGWVAISSGYSNWARKLTPKQKAAFKKWGEEPPDERKARMDSFFSDMC